MAIESNGYWLEYYKKRNRIVITLPQTTETITDTVGIMADRRVDVEDKEMAVLLQTVRLIFEK